MANNGIKGDGQSRRVLCLALGKSMLLNLSDMSGCRNAAETVVRQAMPSSVVDRIVHASHTDMYSDTLTYIIDSFESEGSILYLDELEERFDRTFCLLYKAFKGFHACRIIDESSYMNNGVQGLSEELLLQIALERFGDYASSDAIKEACANTNIKNFESGVYFFTTPEYVTHPSQNHYLQCGSETLQGLAFKLGLANQGILAKQGRPCIIECDVQIDQIQLMFRYDIWKQLVTSFLRELAGKEKSDEPPDWCFSTKGSVSPGCIRHFHYLKDCGGRYVLPLH